MRYCTYLAIVVIWDAARIPRVTGQFYFPNYRNVYQDPNYPNGQADNHAGVPLFGNYKTQEGNIEFGNEYNDRQVSIVDRENFLNHLTAVPFGAVAMNNVHFNARRTVPQAYERFNHPFNYDYQL